MAQRGTQVPADESACNQLQQSQISTSHTSRTDYPGFNSHTDLIFRSQVRKLSTLLRPLPTKLVSQPQSLQFQRSSQDKTRSPPGLHCRAVLLTYIEPSLSNNTKTKKDKRGQKSICVPEFDKHPQSPSLQRLLPNANRLHCLPSISFQAQEITATKQSYVEGGCSLKPTCRCTRACFEGVEEHLRESSKRNTHSNKRSFVLHTGRQNCLFSIVL